MHRKVGTIFDNNGNPMSGVTITVKIAGTANNATLFSDNNRTSLGNPFTNDSNGSFEFYAPNGRYDLVFSKTGATFQASDSTDIVLFDPHDDDTYVTVASDFLCEFISSGIRIYDGGLVLGAAAGAVALQATLKGGVLRVAETGGTAGKIKMVDGASAQVTPFLVTTDRMVMDLDLEKVGDAVTGTRRIGLADGDLGADPTNGIFVRQIDANNAFAVARATTETTLDLGTTLNDRKRIRFYMQTGEVRVMVDDVHIGTITATIPSAALGWAIAGGATASGGGIDIDRMMVAMKR
jgi:hypothetical protein